MMTVRNRPLLAAAGMLAATLLLALVSAPPARTQGAGPGGRAQLPTKPPPPPGPTPVEVKNTPLPVTGSLNATVGGTVQAQQAGPWNVGIAGTPSVNVANSPTVQVGNPLLPVQTFNDALNTPYAETRASEPGIGLSFSDGLRFDVPTGKRLVIESVTVRATVPPGQRARVFFHTNKPLSAGMLTVEPQGVINGFEQLFGTHPIKVRVDDSGSTHDVIFAIERSSGAGDWTIHASVYGFLVDP
jgi:hypothetical protein